MFATNFKGLKPGFSQNAEYVYFTIIERLSVHTFCILTSLFVVFRWSAVMCAYQAGDSLLKLGYVCGVGGVAQTWEEPLANPPSARHGTFAEQEPPTLKACNREQTQQWDLPCTGLSISVDKYSCSCCGFSAEKEQRPALKEILQRLTGQCATWK